MENIYLLIPKEKDSVSGSTEIKTVYINKNVVALTFELGKKNKKKVNFHLFQFKGRDNVFVLKILSTSEERENIKIWKLSRFQKFCSFIKKLDIFKNATINIGIHWGGEKVGGWEEHTKKFVNENNQIKNTDCFLTFYSEAKESVGADNLDKLIKLIEDKIKKKIVFIRNLYALKELCLFKLYPILWSNDSNSLKDMIIEIQKMMKDVMKLKHYSQIEEISIDSIEKLIFSLPSNDNALNILKKIRNEFDRIILDFFMQHPEIEFIYD